MRLVCVCRGMPGLGRVVPSVGLVQTLARRGDVDAVFATYAVGVGYLQRLGMAVEDLGTPAGLFIDSVAPQALSILDLIEHHQPDVVLIDGEPFLPVTLSDTDAPVVYLANPHDLFPGTTPFQRVNRRLLTHADAVVVSSPGSPQPRRHEHLLAGTPCLEVPAIIKEFPVDHHPARHPRVLVTSGGGSVSADPAFREATDAAIRQAVVALGELVRSGQVGTATVVLGADATAAPWKEPWLRVLDQPVELTDLYAHHDVLVARAGRNVTAEALYCGIPTVLLPIETDAHRVAEQAANAAAASKAPQNLAVSDWWTPGTLLRGINTALATAAHQQRRPGLSGNQATVAFIDQFTPTAPRRHDGRR